MRSKALAEPCSYSARTLEEKSSKAFLGMQMNARSPDAAALFEPWARCLGTFISKHARTQYYSLIAHGGTHSAELSLVMYSTVPDLPVVFLAARAPKNALATAKPFLYIAICKLLHEALR
jgi:hypothetical protein